MYYHTPTVYGGVLSLPPYTYRVRRCIITPPCGVRLLSHTPAVYGGLFSHSLTVYDYYHTPLPVNDGVLSHPLPCTTIITPPCRIRGCIITPPPLVRLCIIAPLPCTTIITHTLLVSDGVLSHPLPRTTVYYHTPYRVRRCIMTHPYHVRLISTPPTRVRWCIITPPALYDDVYHTPPLSRFSVLHISPQL